jgi:hypothetical protein
MGSAVIARRSKRKRIVKEKMAWEKVPARKMQTRVPLGATVVAIFNSR